MSEPAACKCKTEEKAAGHRLDCPLNIELAPAPIFERRIKVPSEMTREELINALATYRKNLDVIWADAKESWYQVARLELENAKLREQLQSK